MSDKPLCGYCYNDCTDDCCDKRRIDVLERQLAEARDEVDYAINFFSKNEQFGVVGILKGIKNKLKEQGDE